MATVSLSLQRVALKAPFSQTDIEAIQRELTAILASGYFRNSRRYPTFLTYIVETAVKNSSADIIKERSIGTEAFGRPPDYDTNLDPIVRNTAGEVRKRLALYYAEHPSLESRVEISLQLGSYVPEFYLLNPASPASPRIESPRSDEGRLPTLEPLVSQAAVIDRPAVALPPTREVPNVRRHSFWFWGLGVVLLAGLGFLFQWWRTPQPEQSLWADFFASRHDVLVVVPEAPFPPNTTPANWARDNPDIALEDLSAIMPPTGVLMAHRVPYNVKLDPTVSLADLINRPAILVGGPTNKWTVTLTQSLRYRMILDGTKLYIADAEHNLDPVCKYETNVADGSVRNDCALFARFHSPLTGSTVMVIAGAGRNGTQAVGQWILLPNLEKKLSDLLPADWPNKNIEIVLKTTVIGGKNSAPVVVKAFSW